LTRWKLVYQVAIRPHGRADSLSFKAATIATAFGCMLQADEEDSKYLYNSDLEDTEADYGMANEMDI
jgi:hypothetical protein